ncbi:monocarboxylate transporter 4-like [Petromyzon marinus]|uniref:monocarboxylate transporter 4-like n=1 Tax=Petromyzon marinus TaxID=7757 RepID=UPI003F6F48F4
MGGAAPMDDEPQLVPPPDGGWGWVVLFGCFVITGFSYAFPKAISVFFKELINEFDVGYSDTAWLSSILLAMLYGSGPLCSILVNRFGCRPVMLGGGLLASFGMILASFCTNIIMLYLTAGVITGMGLALNFQPSLIMLGRYFNKRRPLANGLAAAGSPVFLTTLSPLGQMLVKSYGWRGGFLILGGLLLNCCACGAVMRPLVPPKEDAGSGGSANAGESKRRNGSRDAGAAEQELTEMLPSKQNGGFVAVPLDDNGSQVAESPSPGTAPHRETPVSPKKKQKKKLLDFSVFKNKGFVIYAVAASIMVIGLFVPPVFIVSYAKDMGIEDTKAAFLLSIIGIIDIFARPLCGILAGVERVRPYITYLFCFAMLFNGFADLMGSFGNTYGGLATFCVFFGISYGMVGALQFEVLMAIVGSHVFSSAIGLVLLCEACAVLIGPPSAGRLVDATKNYKLTLYMAGTLVTISGIVMGVANFFCLPKVQACPHAAPPLGPGKEEGQPLTVVTSTEPDPDAMHNNRGPTEPDVEANEVHAAPDKAKPPSPEEKKVDAAPASAHIEEEAVAAAVASTAAASTAAATAADEVVAKAESKVEAEPKVEAETKPESTGEAEAPSSKEPDPAPGTTRADVERESEVSPQAEAASGNDDNKAATEELKTNDPTSGGDSANVETEQHA